MNGNYFHVDEALQQVKRYLERPPGLMELSLRTLRFRLPKRPPTHHPRIIRSPRQQTFCLYARGFPVVPDSVPLRSLPFQQGWWELKRETERVLSAQTRQPAKGNKEDNGCCTVVAPKIRPGQDCNSSSSSSPPPTLQLPHEGS